MNQWEGQRVRLRAIEPDDWPHFYEWNKDSNIGRTLDFVWFPQSAELVKKTVAEEAVKVSQGDKIGLVIETLRGDFVGSISSHSMERRTGTFAYGIAVIDAQQRMGYASEAIIILLRHFFTELRYQKVTVTVFSFNEASIALHERLGFVLEGRLRRMGFTDGEYFDHLMYGMTAEEFAVKHPQVK